MTRTEYEILRRLAEHKHSFEPSDFDVDLPAFQPIVGIIDDLAAAGLIQRVHEKRREKHTGHDFVAIVMCDDLTPEGYAALANAPLG